MNQEQKKRKLELQRIRRSKNIELEREKARVYYSTPERKEKARLYNISEKGREYKKTYLLKKNYNLSVEEYNNLKLLQNNLCALCFKPETKKHGSGTQRSLNVDHCHTTGKVRGLLCSNCNMALGLLNDDINVIKRIINYL